MEEYLDNDIKDEDELEIIEGNDDNESIKFETLTYPATYSMREVANYLKDERFKIPSFQRKNNVWNLVGKSRLIESYLMGIPVPPIFLFQTVEQSNQGIFQVIDGLQRVTVIKEYLENSFLLTGLGEAPYNKKKFDQLEQGTQNKLNALMVQATVIRQLTPEDDQSIYSIFERVNSGGVKLNRMEIRRAMNTGHLLKQVEILNKNKDWRKIWGKEKEDKRFLDVEIILRIFCLFEDIDKYKNAMAPSIDTYTATYKYEKKEELCKLFVSACKIITDNLEPKPFHRKRINVSMLDSVFIVVMKIIQKNIKTDYEVFKKNWEMIKSYPEGMSNEKIENEEINSDMKAYRETIERSTSNTEAIKKRHKIAEKYLFPS